MADGGAPAPQPLPVIPPVVPPVPPVQLPAPCTQQAVLTAHLIQPGPMAQLNWSHFKPKFTGVTRQRSGSTSS